jgi:hypothetical protein
MFFDGSPPKTSRLAASRGGGPADLKRRPFLKRSVPVCRTCFAKRLDAFPDRLCEPSRPRRNGFLRLSQSAEQSRGKISARKIHRTTAAYRGGSNSQNQKRPFSSCKAKAQSDLRKICRKKFWAILVSLRLVPKLPLGNANSRNSASHGAIGVPRGPRTGPAKAKRELRGSAHSQAELGNEETRKARGGGTFLRPPWGGPSFFRSRPKKSRGCREEGEGIEAGPRAGVTFFRHRTSDAGRRTYLACTPKKSLF